MSASHIMVVTGDHVTAEGHLHPVDAERFARLVRESKPGILRHGDDRLGRAAAACAKRLGLQIRVQRWPADWKKYEREGQPNPAVQIRDRAMLLGRSEVGHDAGGRAHQLAVFPGKGDGCMETARALSIAVVRIAAMRSAQSLEYERIGRQRLSVKDPADKQRLADQAQQIWNTMDADEQRHLDAFWKWLRPEAA